MALICIIDDDTDFLDVYQTLLPDHGYEVATATNPEDGIELVKTRHPDLVILDIMMPDGYEGFDVAKKIREELNLRHLPIIVLSSVHEAKQIPYRFAPDETYLPVDLWLDKPVKPGVLVETIKSALGDLPKIPG
ncbi:MAG: response regulator [Bradymonadales bacterium]|nr:response regulator [Bradymonadales bacterium]